MKELEANTKRPGCRRTWRDSKGGHNCLSCFVRVHFCHCGAVLTFNGDEDTYVTVPVPGNLTQEYKDTLNEKIGTELTEGFGDVRLTGTFAAFANYTDGSTLLVMKL